MSDAKSRKRRYTARQKLELDLLRQIHEEHVTARATLRQKIEEEYAARLSDYEFRESRQMNKCLRTLDGNGRSIAKTDIGRAVGTSNWNLLAEKYALTADEFAEIYATPYEVRWENRRESVRLLRFMEIRVDILFDFDEQGDYVAVEGADDEPAQILLDKLDSGEYADEWKQMWTDLKEERQ